MDDDVDGEEGIKQRNERDRHNMNAIANTRTCTRTPTQNG